MPRDKIEIPVALFNEMEGMLDAEDPGYHELCAKLDALRKLANVPRYHIAGRRWFQKSAGNTYHRVVVYENDEEVFDSGKHYGYGEQYLQTAMAWLKANRELPGEPSSSTVYIREVLGATWNVVDVSREKDL